MSKKILSNAAGAAAIAFMLLCTVFPFVYAVCKSLGGWRELLLWSPGFTRAYFNTFLCASAVTVLNIVIAVPSAYFFRVCKAKFKNIPQKSFCGIGIIKVCLQVHKAPAPYHL